MNDPIVDELHRTRERIWDACGQDWDRLAEYFKQKSAQHPERMITAEEIERSKARNRKAVPTSQTQNNL